MDANQWYDQTSNEPDPLQSVLQALPSLPSSIRYYDDFDDQLRTIKDIEYADKCELHIHGSRSFVYFSKFDAGVDKLAKHLLLFYVSNDLQPKSVYDYLISLYKVERHLINQIIKAGPLGIKALWFQLLSQNDWTIKIYGALKGFIKFLAQNHLCGWSPSYNEFISKTLPLPDVDKYASIRIGDVFLSIEEEARIVRFLDELTESIRGRSALVATEELRLGGMLLCAYQFAMRPVQIASLTHRDVKIWPEAENENDQLSVHLTFRMVKQRSKSSARPMLRKVKREWAPIIIELQRRALVNNESPNERFFSLNSASKVSQAIIKLASSLTESDSGALMLRHTAAQRLVDAGASQEELAEFMGHTDITTGLVYYKTSPNQAERVNEALGISPIYQAVAKIAHDRFISPQELSELKGEQQVAGVPHGLPISGIGGCSSGQPSCPYNPVTSCYGCQKFLPVQDIAVHQQVLEDFRGVVMLFAGSSKGDASSPTYLQLKKTIGEVQQVIFEIERAHDA